jgi:hypothetical protein
MSDYRCPAHPDTKLVYLLKGGAGYCLQCRMYTQAAGVPEPKPAKRTKAPDRKKAPRRAKRVNRDRTG